MAKKPKQAIKVDAKADDVEVKVTTGKEIKEELSQAATAVDVAAKKVQGKAGRAKKAGTAKTGAKKTETMRVQASDGSDTAKRPGVAQARASDGSGAVNVKAEGRTEAGKKPDVTKKANGAKKSVPIKKPENAKRTTTAKKPATQIQIETPKVTQIKVETPKKTIRVEATEKKPAEEKRKYIEIPVVLRVLGGVLAMMGFAAFLAWFIIWRQKDGNFGATEAFIAEKPSLFAYSGLVVFCLLALMVAVTWRVFFTMGLSFALVSIITYVNAQKFMLRNTPLLPSDFQMAGQAGNLMGFIDGWSVVRLVIGVVLVLVGSGLLEKSVRKVFRRDTTGMPWWRRTQIVPRVTFASMSFALLCVVASPIIRRENPSWLPELAYANWSQTENYKDNGFVIGFLYNMTPMPVKASEDYGEQEMMKVAQIYREKKAKDTKRKPLNEVVDNLIIILDESTYDPSILERYANQAEKDVLPNIHRIFQEYPSGYMYSPEYGGNTANVEFEVQTGLSNYWLMGVPYSEVIPGKSSLLSAGKWAKNFGFAANGVHSYTGAMWERQWNYPIMGYDDFIAVERFSYQDAEYDSVYVNDSSLYREVMDILEGEDDPQMVMAITMQSHAPYDTANYPEIEFGLKNTEGIKNVELIEADFQSLYEADKYLGELFERLEGLDERTAVLVFGDHAAGILDEYIDAESQEERHLAHITPYFVWANFKIKSPYSEKEVAKMNKELGFEFKTKGVNLPTVTPNCLQNMLYDILGVEKPALFYLVDEVCEEVPVLARPYWGANEPEMTDAMRAYELVNYDVLVGEHYWDGE